MVVSALTQGKQIILLRKGGLSDQENLFSLEHKEFFMFPTHLHQQRITVGREHLEKGSKFDVLTLTTYANSKGIFWVKNLNLLKKLEPFHIFSIDEIKNRFSRGKIPGIQVLLLRVYKLSSPVQIPMLPHFQGCKSWVDLGKEIPLLNFQPVLEDNAFYHQVKQIKKICDGE